MYYLIIQDGTVFEGSISDFGKRFFSLPEDCSEEEILFFIEDWAESNGWSFEYKMIN